MPGEVSFWRRLWIVVTPTTTQVLGCLFVAFTVLLLTQSHSLLAKVGLDTATLEATQAQFEQRFDTILTSPIASQLALITFWALVGLVAYLVCWGVYNTIIEVRNEVTLSTAYTNRGHWRGPFETLALKAVAAVALAFIVNSLWYGLSWWITLFSQIVNHFTFGAAGLALLAALGLATQLYLIIVFIQLTFTPWYRAQSFTDA